MATKRESILAAIVTTLAGTTGVSTRIYRSRVEAFARSEAPALVIEPGTDSAAEELVSTCKIDWRLPVLIAVYTRGAIPDQLADPIINSIHTKLMADRTLGGLVMDIWPGTVDPQIESADQPALWTVCTYNVRYRTSVTSLTA
jgi:hypothetical protein